MSEFNIKELRLRKRLSQEELGKQLGVSKQTISSWETESRSPNKKQRQSILRIFKLKSREQLEAENKELKFKLDYAENELKDTVHKIDYEKLEEWSENLALLVEELYESDEKEEYIVWQKLLEALKEYRGE